MLTNHQIQLSREYFFKLNYSVYSAITVTWHVGKSQTQCVVGVPWSLSPSWPWAWAPLHHTDTDVGKSYPEVRLGQHWDPAKVKIANQTWVVILSSNHSLKQLNQVLFQHWNQSMLTSKLPCQQTHKVMVDLQKIATRACTIAIHTTSKTTFSIKNP